MSKLYLNQVIDSIIDAIPEHYSPDEYNSLVESGDIETELYENFIYEDSITGNGSGSYTFNRNAAKEMILEDNFETVEEAVDEGIYSIESFVQDLFDGNWEKIDVICRCQVLPKANAKIVFEHPIYDF